MELQIRHTGTADGQSRFVVVRLSDGKCGESVSLTPPGNVPVATHNTNLQDDLRWYLESFLELPTGPNIQRAADIQAALSLWGRACFDALFGNDARATGWYRDARQNGLSFLRLKIVSDDPAVLSWPWEALESTDDGLLALQCRIERALDGIGDIRRLPDTLPQEQLNILYIITRPFGDNDVGYQTLARPLIDFVEKGRWPVHIDFLRPPTFKQLQMYLESKPGFYHIVHFDGHGQFSANSGVLAFEKDNPQHNADRCADTYTSLSQLRPK